MTLPLTSASASATDAASNLLSSADPNRQPATSPGIAHRLDERPDENERDVRSTGPRTGPGSSSDAERSSHHIIVLVTVLPAVALLAVFTIIAILCCLRKPHYTKLFGRASSSRLAGKPRHVSANGARRPDSSTAAWSSAQGSNSVRLLASDARSLSVAGSGSGAPVVPPSVSAAPAWCEQSIPASGVPLALPLPFSPQSNHQMFSQMLAASVTSCSAPACVPNLLPTSAGVFPSAHLYSAAPPMMYSVGPPPPPNYMCAAPTTYFGQTPSMAFGNGLSAHPDLSESVDDSGSAGGTSCSPTNLQQTPQQTQSASSFEQQRSRARRHAKHAVRANQAAGRAQSGSSELTSTSFALQPQQQQSSPMSSTRQLAPPGANKSSSRTSVSNNLPAAVYQFTSAATPATNANALYPQAYVQLPVGHQQLPPVAPSTYHSALQQQQQLDMPPINTSDVYSSVDSAYAMRPARP